MILHVYLISRKSALREGAWEPTLRPPASNSLLFTNSSEGETMQHSYHENEEPIIYLHV